MLCTPHHTYTSARETYTAIKSPYFVTDVPLPLQALLWSESSLAAVSSHCTQRHIQLSVARGLYEDITANRYRYRYMMHACTSTGMHPISIKQSHFRLLSLNLPPHLSACRPMLHPLWADGRRDRAACP